MTTVTKRCIREMSSDFSLFCSEQKTDSLPPCQTSQASPRVVFKAKRRAAVASDSLVSFPNPTCELAAAHEDRFASMTDEQYMQYQEATAPERMKRKRKFGVFSSGSNASLNDTLKSCEPQNVAPHALFYVRIDSDCATPSVALAPDVEMKQLDSYPDKGKECSVTKCVSVSGQWVQAFATYKEANNSAWRQLHANAKIHEYQIGRMHGITLLNICQSNQKKDTLDSTNTLLMQNVKEWVLAHSYSGFILDGCFHFFQPHGYWNLLDDNKQCHVKQKLISDMFRTHASNKPSRRTWNNSFD